MATLTPFRALHYNTQKVALADVITPPYDVITPDEAVVLKDRSPYNFAHVDLPNAADADYHHAAETLRKWRELGILIEDRTPAYYLYQQVFQINGVQHVRRSLMAAVLLHEFSDGVIRPHENTFGKYKEDRLRQMAGTQCNLSHIFGMVKDAAGTLGSVYEETVFHPPLLNAKANDGVQHAVWRIDPAKNAAIEGLFAQNSIYIVDGHHRYESALRFARESGTLGNREAASAYMLFAIANVFDPALVVLPTHRYVTGIPAEKIALDRIEQFFDLMRMTLSDLTRFISKPAPVPTFGLYLDGSLYLCTPKHWQAEEATWGKSITRLAVAWSDRKLLGELGGVDDTNRSEKVSYGKDVESLWEKRAQASAIIFHAPPAVQDVTKVADENTFMPQKSTYFYPKIGAGLVIRPLK